MVQLLPRQSLHAAVVWTILTSLVHGYLEIPILSTQRSSEPSELESSPIWNLLGPFQIGTRGMILTCTVRDLSNSDVLQKLHGAQTLLSVWEDFTQ